MGDGEFTYTGKDIRLRATEAKLIMRTRSMGTRNQLSCRGGNRSRSGRKREVAVSPVASISTSTRTQMGGSNSLGH